MRPLLSYLDETEGGLDGSALTIGILAMLLIGAAFAIIILMRREKSEDSIFYDEDEWEEEETEDYIHENVKPILPPLAPEKNALDSASDVFIPTEKGDEVEDVESAGMDDESEVDENQGNDAQSDVQHSE